MAQIRACLFDLDGVLVDTAKYHYQAWKKLANSLGFDITEQQNEGLKGLSRPSSLKKLLAIGNKTVDDDTFIDLMERKNNWYLELINGMNPDEVLPGAREFVQEVKDAGLAVGLGSASKNARKIIEKVNMADMFDSIVDGHRVTKGKPDPQTFQMGAEDLGVKPSETVVFEDASAGVEAALAGGMKAVGVGDPKVLSRANVVIPGLKNQHLELLNQLS